MREKSLKSYQDYADRYDRHTVEICRKLDDPIDEGEDTVLPGGEVLSKEKALGIKKWAKEMMLHFHTGERYLKKEETIQEWMDADRERDELYESAQPPEGIRCLTCRNRVTPTFKTFWYGGEGKAERVFFMFDCPNKCLPRRAFFSNGEEYRIQPSLCPNCRTPLDHTEEDYMVKVVTTYTCPKCEYVKTDEYVWTKNTEEEIDLNFAADRNRFCLTDEEGKKFQEEKWSMESAGKFMDEINARDAAREEKLKLNPGGFLLEEGYSCAICDGDYQSRDCWFDEWGIKCLVCQKAIDVGEIPPSVAKDKDSWYSKYDLEKSFNLKSAARKKWIQKGILKPRIITRYGKGEHYELFLIEDNEGFLPPKELVKSEWANVKNEDGTVQNRNVPWYQIYDPNERLKGYKIMEHLRVIPP